MNIIIRKMLKFKQITQITNQLVALSLNLTNRRYVQTVPDKVLEHHRTSKLGQAIKAPSVEPKQDEEQQEVDQTAHKNYK